MIKITVNPQLEPKNFVFDQPLIVIGEGSPETVDICFPSEGLHQNHLRIVLKEDGYWVINQANDPFVTHNGQSFGRKKLQIGDLIQIRDHVLRIEELSLNTAPQPVIKAPPVPPEEDPEAFNAYPDVDSLANDENPEAWFPSDISALSNTEREEEAKQAEHPSPQQQPPASSKWKKNFVKAGLVSLLFILALAGFSIFEFYFREHTRSDREEMWAAESLADYAMALTYAKVYHIAPQKQNWVDPAFIKNNLTDLLSSSRKVCCNIDAQGQFCNCAYLLRFYTNRDFSRFLLLAQPEPTLSQWLIPKDTLIIDSDIMEIRTTNDLRTLNRLLSNQNPLDGSNGDEILAEINKATTISLNILAKSIGKREFAPPKALNYLKPGAENRIYNAPRYHQFSGTFLKKAVTFSGQPLTNHELSLLKSELNILAKFPDLVFFSSGGMQEAILGHRALKKLSLPHHFFTAYLLLSDNGDILNSRIVLDSDLATDDEPSMDQMIAEEIAISTPDSPLIPSDEKFLSDILSQQAAIAQKLIHPLLLDMNTLLSDSIEKDSLNLPQSFFELVTLYQKNQAKIRNELGRVLDSFRIKHPGVDTLLVDKALREYGLLDIYTEMTSKIGNSARRRLASDPEFSLPKQLNFSKLSDAGRIRGKASRRSRKPIFEVISVYNSVDPIGFNPNKNTINQPQWKAYQELKEIAENRFFQPPFRIR